MIDASKYKNHTKGPWVVREREPERFIGGVEYRTPYIYSEGDTRYVAEVRSSHQFINMEANAALIADAPMLLDRVIELEAIIKRHCVECKEAFGGECPEFPDCEFHQIIKEANNERT